MVASVAAGQPRGTGDPPLPDAADVVAAFATVRAWIDDFELPPTEAPQARLAVADASGVCVILRQSGRIVGVGTDTTADALMVRRATGRAMSDLLGDPAVANLPEDMLPQVAAAVTLELEIAGRPVPLLGKTYADAAAQLSPGEDGVALRRGENTAMLFPAQLRATNTAGRVERLLPPLAVELGLSALPLPELARRFDVSIYRFRTTTLAQHAAGRPPFATIRGDTLVTDAQVTRAGIQELAVGIAQHLSNTLAPVDAPVGLMGTYRPASDRFSPLIAPPAEQALAAWSLARLSRVEQLPELMAGRIADVSEHILRQLEQVSDGEDEPLASAVACAAIVHAGLEHQGYRDSAPPLLREAAERVRVAYTREDGFVDADESKPVPPHSRALIASALSRLLATGHAGVDAGLVRGALDAAWSSVPPHEQVTLLPWIGWAEADYAAAAGEPLARVVELRNLRQLLDASRVGTADRPGPPDLAGGFALSGGGGSGGGHLLATSQTVRPAAFLAWMIRDPRLTRDDEAAVAAGRMLQTIRFIGQLSVRPSSRWAYVNPGRALGGIRAAVWNCDQPVPAQALALVTAAEMLTSLDTLASRDEKQ